MVWFSVSATYTLPVESTATPKGLLKRAAEPTPSAVPGPRASRATTVSAPGPEVSPLGLRRGSGRPDGSEPRSPQAHARTAHAASTPIPLVITGLRPVRVRWRATHERGAR